MATDPVCGMTVEERPTSLQFRRDNRTYYFCSETCLHQFAEPAAAQRRLSRQIAVAWPLALVVVGLTYGLRGETSTVVAATLATVVQVYAGAPFYRGARDAVVDRTWNMDLLIAVGTTTAYVYSLAALLLPSRLPSEFFFDASSLIIALILTGNYLEHRTRREAGSALRRLGELIPETVIVVRDEHEVEVPASTVGVGDRVRVRPGARIPADAVVLAGRTQVDESILTGESAPVVRQLGDRVLAGSVNGEGQIDVRATGVGSDTFLAEVGRLLTDAEMSRVPLQRSADRIASVFVPGVLVLGAIAAFLWLGVGAGVTVAVLVFVTVVITACPCAFGLATPAAILVGTGRAAESGILFRGEDAIERAARVTVVLSDKTGTLTRGELGLASVDVAPGRSPEQAIAVAAAVESALRDPYARAIARAAERRRVVVPPASEITVDPGRGVRGTVGPHVVEVVRATPDSLRSSDPSLASALARGTARGDSVSVVRESGVPIAVLSFHDELADGVPEGLASLRADGIRVAIVTGDHPVAARRVADELGVDEVYAELDPAQKLDVIRRARVGGAVVAYVGDGINDAPALAEADLGMAVGSGTAVAREAGQVLLVRSDFRSVPLALRIARRTVAKVRGNLVWAIGYNAILLPVAVGVLVPWFGLGIYSVLPILGAAAMGLSSTGVVLNSLSLRNTTAVAPRAPVARMRQRDTAVTSSF